MGDGLGIMRPAKKKRGRGSGKRAQLTDLKRASALSLLHASPPRLLEKAVVLLDTNTGGRGIKRGRTPVSQLLCEIFVRDLFGGITDLQGSEVPSLGTFSGTLSGKWAKVGKMGENGGK